MDWTAVENRPGSFSKNFGWDSQPGMKLLHDVIRAIFPKDARPVRRDDARKIIEQKFQGSPLIPLNFFLYNKVVGGEDFILPDELVAHALSEEHSRSFDLLAVCALNFSRVGRWSTADSYQSHPAPWARSFILDVLYDQSGWNASNVRADTIESYLLNRLQYRGKSPRKYATNLNFIYERSGLFKLKNALREEWWTSALFLFLDRATFDGEISISDTPRRILRFLDAEKFWALTAVDLHSGRIAARDAIDDYIALGSTSRLSLQATDGRTTETKKKRQIGNKSKRISKPHRPKDTNQSPVQRIYAQAQRQVRNKNLPPYLKSLYADRCVICGEALYVDHNNTPYSEAGHVKPVGKPIHGPDHLSNLLIFCPNHHKVFDRGGVWIETGKKSPVVRSATQDKTFDGRKIALDPEHGFDLDFAEWHSEWFGHTG